MILYLELTNPRRMRFESKLDIEVLPELNEFMARFAERRGWDEAMKNRLSAVGEETLLTLAPLDLEGNGEVGEERRLVVMASSDGEVAELEFIGGGDDETNIEDRVRQLQQHDSNDVVEIELIFATAESGTRRRCGTSSFMTRTSSLCGWSRLGR